eukprot:341375-Rhodomonas_salina.1
MSKSGARSYFHYAYQDMLYSCTRGAISYQTSSTRRNSYLGEDRLILLVSVTALILELEILLAVTVVNHGLPENRFLSALAGTSGFNILAPGEAHAKPYAEYCPFEIRFVTLNCDSEDASKTPDGIRYPTRRVPGYPVPGHGSLPERHSRVYYYLLVQVPVVAEKNSVFSNAVAFTSPPCRYPLGGLGG